MDVRNYSPGFYEADSCSRDEHSTERMMTYPVQRSNFIASTMQFQFVSGLHFKRFQTLV